MHPLYRISAYEDGQELELQLDWSAKDEDDYEEDNDVACSSSDEDEDDARCCDNGDYYCSYNESELLSTEKLHHHNHRQSDSVITGTTISTCDSSSSASSRLSSSDSSSLVLSSSPSCNASSNATTDKHDSFLQHTVSISTQYSTTKEDQEPRYHDDEEEEGYNNEKEHPLYPVTGHYSNLYDHYYIPSSSTTSSSSTIGSGQYGKVQNCIHIPTGKSYAVKSILKSSIDRLDHLRREIYLLTLVTDHPNIIKIVDYHEDSEYVHIVSDKYCGGELFDVIVEHTCMTGCLSESYAASIIKSLLEAVGHLHSLDIVHRDIKPENILFEFERGGCDDDGDLSSSSSSSSSSSVAASSNPIRLIDFGLSRKHNIDIDGYMSNPVGTSYYMSPEVLQGKYTKSCDIWSVGITTYILLCGYPPFNGASEAEIKSTILNYGHAKNVNFTLRGWAGKSEECKDFIMCLLRRDPRKRFTAKEALMHPWLKIYC